MSEANKASVKGGVSNPNFSMTEDVLILLHRAFEREVLPILESQPLQAFDGQVALLLQQIHLDFRRPLC